ncbi:MAG: hypothetical protein H7062_17300 [Candidatus Saccharimonas sp.]|nr:hypothetical protein [Planctomycetaceae bacterium]
MIILLIWNGFEAVHYSFASLVVFWWVSPIIDSPSMEKAFQKRGVTVEEVRAAISNGQLFAVVYASLRVAACACLVMLFLWKRWAFWCFVACTALIFLVNLWGGASIWEASPDLVGLAVLIALLLKSKPVAWPQLK